MSHWNWQTSFVMTPTVAPRDILWQSMNVTLATKRILLLFTPESSPPTFWGTSIKISKREHGTPTRTIYLAYPCFLWAPEGSNDSSFTSEPEGSALGNESSPEKPAYKYSSGMQTIASVKSSAKPRDGSKSFQGIHDFPNPNFCLPLWSFLGHSQLLPSDFLNQSSSSEPQNLEHNSSYKN